MRRLVDDVDDHARIVCGGTERSGRLALERTDSDRFAGEIGGRPWPTLDRYRPALCRRDRYHFDRDFFGEDQHAGAAGGKKLRLPGGCGIAAGDERIAAIELEEDGKPCERPYPGRQALSRFRREQERNRHGAARPWIGAGWPAR